MKLPSKSPCIYTRIYILYILLFFFGTLNIDVYTVDIIYIYTLYLLFLFLHLVLLDAWVMTCLVSLSIWDLNASESRKAESCFSVSRYQVGGSQPLDRLRVSISLGNSNDPASLRSCW